MRKNCDWAIMRTFHYSLTLQPAELLLRHPPWFFALCCAEVGQGGSDTSCRRPKFMSLSIVGDLKLRVVWMTFGDFGVVVPQGT